MVAVTPFGFFRWHCLLWIYVFLTMYLIGSIQFERSPSTELRFAPNNVRIVFPATQNQFSALSSSSVFDPFPIPSWNSSAVVRAVDWPPLESLLTGANGSTSNNIVNRADVSFLLDFVILGHNDYGTEYLKRALNAHSEVAMFQHEHACDFLYRGNPASLVRSLYMDLPQDATFRGFYCNNMLLSSRKSLSLLYLNKYFVDAKLLVGVQNPVLYFQSMYNDRLRHPLLFPGRDNKVSEKILPNPDLLIGKCRPEYHGVCTDNAKFHAHLVKLGKTNFLAEEQALLNWRYQTIPKIPFIRNDLFLFDFSQLIDKNQTRLGQFLLELQEFLGLSSPLNISVSTQHFSSDKSILDICDSKYMNLRQELLGIGKNASYWILNYLLKYDNGVSVGNPEFFERLLRNWKTDPCPLQDITH